MINRHIKNQLMKSLNTYPVTLITGSRQVGKSTLCYLIAEELGYTYLSLDDISLRDEAIKDPKFFLLKYKTPLIIDEIQYAPILFEVIEQIVNRARLTTQKSNGLFLLTGSQSFHLMKGITQSLAGRVNIISMLPLSNREINTLENKSLSYNVEDYFNINYQESIDNIYQKIVKGFYPEIYKNPELNSTRFYKMYVSTYIDRDVSEIIKIKDKMKFHQFLQYIASLTGQQINYNTISKALAIDVRTIKEWFGVLESSCLIYFLQPYYDTSITKRIVKTPKLYFYDTGLACYLARINDYKTLEASFLSGSFLETYVVNEIIKGFTNNDKEQNIYYYRDSNQNEIDLIILENATLHLIEIKTGTSIDKKLVKSFSQLSSSIYKTGTSYLLCMCNVLQKIDENIFALPIYFI